MIETIINGIELRFDTSDGVFSPSAIENAFRHLVIGGKLLMVTKFYYLLKSKGNIKSRK